MILEGFNKVVMGALFGELAGYNNCKGIQYLGFGSGKTSWNSGTIESVDFQASGLYNEKFRIKPDSIYFTEDITVSGTNIFYINDSGLRVNIIDSGTGEKNYRTHHLNGLKILVRSGTSGSVLINRMVSGFTSGTNEILFESGIQSLGTVESFSIEDVKANSGNITENILVNFVLRLQETEKFNCREEGVIGGIAKKDDFETGNFINIVRFKNRPSGGDNIIVERQYHYKIPSGIFVNSDENYS